MNIKFRVLFQLSVLDVYIQKTYKNKPHAEELHHEKQQPIKNANCNMSIKCIAGLQARLQGELHNNNYLKMLLLILFFTWVSVNNFAAWCNVFTHTRVKTRQALTSNGSQGHVWDYILC